ncbi:MAG: endo-1,4-beta-xylanase [Bacteroidales bacterium]|nr:endo-1,4-beta-xylanase [Bacteroidales bacterium]
MRRIVIAALAAACLVACNSVKEYPSLKDAYADAFPIGCSVYHSVISGQDSASQELFLREFNTFTPNNDFEPLTLHPTPDKWDFTPGEQNIAFAKQHGLKFTGHTLVWHNRTPQFFWNRPDGQPKSREELTRTLTEYVRTVTRHFSGDVDSWTVINEIISEEGGYRDIGWVKAFGGDGDEVMRLAFQAAAEGDPVGDLYYNDYNLWRPSKVQGVVRAVNMLREAGIKIDGVGIQAHWGLDYPEMHYVEEAIDIFSSMGLKVMITELDVDVLPISRWGQTSGSALRDPMFQREEFMRHLDPYKDGLPPEIDRELADRYAEIMRTLYRHRDQIERVTFWDLSDGLSWKNNYPIPNRTNYPLLFDRNQQKKQAYYSVVSVPAEFR